jgi:beta-galactosidase
MSRHFVSAAALLAGVAVSFAAAAAPRVTTPLEADWRFLQGDPQGAEASNFDDAKWKTVSVPNDWQIAGPFSADAPGRGGQAYLPTGVAWYRKALDIRPQPGRRYFIELDGVMEKSRVFVNGQEVGYRPNGYISLRYDITPFLRGDGKNVLAVRADTSAAPSSRWYAGGGVYRKARLIETGDVFVPQSGLFVSASKVSADSATIDVSVEVSNLSGAPRDAKVEVTLVDPKGTEVARVVASANIGASKTEVFKPHLTIARPAIWSLETRNLYKARVRVLGADDAVLDDDVATFGVREFHFDSSTGFWLNGKNFKLKGVALHHDGGPVGAAVPKDVWIQRLTNLKKLGVNAIRTAHNEHSPELLDAADELGFIVMDEFFDQWLVGKTPYDYHLYFADWHQKDAAAIVRRDRNHPSIVLYSIGNEIHDTPNAESAKASLKSIVDVVHANDPTRPATQALFRPNVSHDYDNGLADMLDVVGQNYRENELIAANKQNPNRKIIGTENTHNASNWTPVRDYPAYSGMFIWTGVDYLGEALRWPNIMQHFGLLDRVGEVKISGLQRQSWWAETPVVNIVRNSDPSAAGPPTDDPMTNPQFQTPPPPAPGAPPGPRAPRTVLFADWTPENAAPHGETIEVYSNCQSVEAFLNGKSLGTKPINQDATPRRWTVTYKPGEVRAVCRDKGVTASASLKTAGAPVGIALSADKTAVGSAFDDIAFVRARVVDAKGITVPGATQNLQVKVTGPGAFVAADAGSIDDHTPFQNPERKPVWGGASFLVRGAGAGPFSVEVSGEGLKPATLQLNATR